jgi:hypothetical protein
MNKLIALVSGLTLLFQTLPVDAIATQQSKPKTFTQWCQKRNSVPEATKLTIYYSKKLTHKIVNKLILS